MMRGRIALRPRRIFIDTASVGTVGAAFLLCPSITVLFIVTCVVHSAFFMEAINGRFATFGAVKESLTMQLAFRRQHCKCSKYPASTPQRAVFQRSAFELMSFTVQSHVVS